MECKGVLMGCTGPREPGWDPTWPAVDRVGSRRWAPLTPPLRRGGRGGCEEGVADEGHTLATAPYYRPLRTLSGELVLAVGRGSGQFPGYSSLELVLRSCRPSG